jgi:hypothetical protein
MSRWVRGRSFSESCTNEAVISGRKAVIPIVARDLHSVALERLERQFLLSRPFTSAATVVKTLGAVQAQDYAGAKWALALRMKKPTSDAIEGAMTRGEIIRTHVLRPTWHFVTPADLRWMMALTGPRVSLRMKTYNATMGITPAMFRRSNDVMARQLEGGKQLTRQELAAALRASGVAIQSVQHLAHLMMQAELDGVVCSGGLRGKQFTYALIDERVPATKPLDRDDALLRLTRLYFASRSPATLQDFSWWSGLPMADAKRGAEMAKLEAVNVGGRAYLTADGEKARAPKKPVAHLLPNYDEYFIGHKDRSAIGQRLARAGSRMPEGSAFWNMIVLDGQIVGGWKRVVVRKGMILDLRLITPLKSNERQTISRAAAEYAAFLGASTSVRGV